MPLSFELILGAEFHTFAEFCAKYFELQRLREGGVLIGWETTLLRLFCLPTWFSTALFRPAFTISVSGRLCWVRRVRPLILYPATVFGSSQTIHLFAQLWCRFSASLFPHSAFYSKNSQSFRSPRVCESGLAVLGSSQTKAGKCRGIYASSINATEGSGLWFAFETNKVRNGWLYAAKDWISFIVIKNRMQ